MRKLCDGSKLSNMGFHPEVSLKEGLEITYKYYLEMRLLCGKLN